MPFTVLGGYLGAGKTTLLNRLLRDNQGLRIALLINDFGAINIDADLIEKQTDQQINLTNGCVCCGLSDGFDAAIDQLLKSEPVPEHIVVEASGVADVFSLAQYGKTPGLTLDGVLVVADAVSVQQKAQDKYVANTVQRQLKAADLLVLNKADLVSPERLQQVKNWLNDLTGSTPTVTTTFCELPHSLLLGNNRRWAAKSRDADKIDADAAALDNHHHEDYVTWNFTSKRRVKSDAAKQMLAEFPPELLRGKGFIATFDSEREGTLEWHKVGRQERLTPSSLKTPTALVAIGLRGQIDTALLTRIAQRYLEQA